MHELVLLRNMHDCGGGDIPIIITSWPADFTARALDYGLSSAKMNGQTPNAMKNVSYSAYSILAD